MAQSGPSRSDSLTSLLCILALWSALAAPAGSLRKSHATPDYIHWKPVGLSGGGAMFTPAISPADPDLMMLNCDMSGAYISEDGGRDWRMINHLQLESDTHCSPAFHPTNLNVIYASSDGQLRVSRDRGRTFRPLGNLKSPLYGAIAIDPSNPDVLLAGTAEGRCWISRDAGVTWTVCVGPQGRVLGFHFDSTQSGRIMFAATGQGIWRSDDSGKTWHQKTQGLPWKQIQGFAGGSDSSNGVVMLYCTTRSKVENGVFKGGIYRSSDRGESWQSAMGRGLNTETRTADAYAYGPVSQYEQILTADARPLTVYAMNTSTGFFPPHSDTVYRSDDGGTNWRAVYFEDPRFKRYNVQPDYVTATFGQSFKGGEPPFGAAVCNGDPDRLILTRNEVQITDNGGRTWLTGHTRPAPGPPPGPGSAWLCNGLVVTTSWHFYVDPFETSRQYIAYTDIGLARSLDGGQSWIWWNPHGLPPWRNTCYELAFDPAIPGKIWGAFSDVHDIPNNNIISEHHNHKLPGGVCLSLDFGASWKPDNRGLPAKPVTSIVLDPRSPKDARVLYAGVFGAGVYKSTDDGRTWVLKSHGLGDPSNMRVSRMFLHPDGTLFAMICARRAGRGQPLLPQGVGLYRSRDGAETWVKINASRPLLYPKDFSVDPKDSRRILIGACDADGHDRSGGLYLTDNGGKSWRRIGRKGPQTFGGYFHPQFGWIYMTLTEGAPGPGLWLSRDGGHTWTPFKDLPFGNIQRVEFDPGDASHIHVTTFGGGVWIGPRVP